MGSAPVSEARRFQAACAISATGWRMALSERPEHLHPVIVVKAQQRDVARDLEPEFGRGLQGPERQHVVEGEDGGRPRRLRQPGGDRGSDLRHLVAGLDHVGLRAGHVDDRGVDAGQALANIADGGGGDHDQQVAVAKFQQALRALVGGSDIVHGDGVDLPAVVERPVDDDEGYPVPLQHRPRRKTAVTGNRDDPGRAPGGQRLDLPRLLDRIAAAGGDQKTAPAEPASRSSLSTSSAKNGLPSSGTMAPTTVRWELRNAEAATSRR